MISDSGTSAAEDATLSGVFGQTLEPSVGPPLKTMSPLFFLQTRISDRNFVFWKALQCGGVVDAGFF